MNTKDFYYDLPKELIAQVPLLDRASSKLMILDKEKHTIEHRKFGDIIEYISPNDCLVLNNTKVIPARLIGCRKDTGSAIEILLLNRYSKSMNFVKLEPLKNDNENIWECLVKPGKKAKIGNKIVFGNNLLTGEIIDILEDGNRIIKFAYDGIFEEILDKLGTMPLPPYITEKLSEENKNRYQTVYAKYEGSAAAPTAGLHFTNELLDKIRDKGVKIVYVTLHVGLGTFRPVKVDNILEHKMHSEYYNIPKETADIINSVKSKGGNIIAVGTTSCRTLEAAANNSILNSGDGNTDIFIYPGYKFQIVDKLITNFHLPESTLMMLISALADRNKILDAYKCAVENKYRFFSFGDAMFIK